MNINILSISELKWTGMGKFNSHDNCIYYCGQECLQRNRVALIVNKSLKCSSVQLLSLVRLFTTPWTAAHQASQSITNLQRLPKLMSMELVMPSNHFTLCSPILLPSIFPSIRGFSSESVLHTRWPKYWRFSFNISPSNEHPGLISFRTD